MYGSFLTAFENRLDVGWGVFIALFLYEAPSCFKFVDILYEAILKVIARELIVQ